MQSADLIALRTLALRLFAPLERACATPEGAVHLLTELGYVAPGPMMAFEKLSPAIAALDDIFAAVEELQENADAPAITDAGLRALRAFAVIRNAIETIAADIQSDFAGSGILTQTDIVSQIARRLFDYLIARLLEDYYGTLSATLNLLGVIETQTLDEPPSEFDAAYVKRTIHWGKLKTLFGDPLGALVAGLTRNQEVLVYSALYFIGKLGVSRGLPSTLRSPDELLLRLFNDNADLYSLPDADTLTALELPFTDDPAASAALALYPVQDIDTGLFSGIAAALRFGGTTELPLGEQYRLVAKYSANVADGAGITLSRGGQFRVIGNVLSGSPQQLADSVQFGARLAVEPTDPAPSGPLFSVGVPGGSRLQIGSGALAFGIENQGALDLFFEADLKDGVVELRTDEADGFIASILPAGGVSTSFSLGVRFSNRAGLHFKGSSSLSIRTPLHVALGPVSVEYLGTSLALIDDRFVLDVTTGLLARFGPVTAVVDEIGARASFAISDDRSGNLGPLDVSVAFKPPSGVGLTIDAGVIQGGGYLYFDPDRGEYGGVLELTLGDFLSLKAIGLITTRMPDGSPGFSLLIILTAEFSPALQLGFGFRLMGVGGLLGLDRTVDLEAFARGVRTGAASSILFPVDPVANASRVLSDLRAIFPPARNRFLIGPMLKLGWGTPAFIQLDLGLIIESQGHYAIVGVLRILVSDDEGLSILRLQTNFIGALEPDKKRGWFFAAHFDSRLLTTTIEGEMGVLVAGGDDKNVLVSNGGFHPQYEPPALPFPSPRRIAFDIINTDKARIRVECYLAVTTNTVQFGARAELYLGFSGFSIDGHLQFDVLLRRKPFYLIADVSARVALKIGGVGVFNIDIACSLSGPGPWHARGHGSVSLLFVTIRKDFDKTWGDVSTTVLPAIAVAPLLLAEIDRPANWRALTPPSHNLLVSLRKIDTAQELLVLHPLGALEISQNAVPLTVTLDKVGEQKPSDATRLALNVTGGPFAKLRDATRSFAPAEFRNLSDDERLSAPAFQEQPSGVVVGASGNALRTGHAVRRSVRYEVTTVDTLYRRFKPHDSGVSPPLFGHFVANAAVTKSSLSTAQRKQKQPFADGVMVLGERFAVVSVMNNQAAEGSTDFASEYEAREWLRQAAVNDPGVRGRFQVVCADERSVA